jgi:predicted lipoprotein
MGACLDQNRGSAAARWAALLAAGALGVASCDKPPLPEKIAPYAGRSGAGVGPGAGGHIDLPDGGGFTAAPPEDAGDAEADAGAQAASSCGEPPAADTPFSKRALLGSIAQCGALHACEFDALAAELADKAAAYADDPGAQTLEAVQGAWYRALKHWQIEELFRFGPGAPAMEPAGQGLDDQIYAFPLISRCTTDEMIVDQAYENGGVARVLPNGRGLAALEYLLFYSGGDNACASFHRINAQGLWAALSPDELQRRRQLLTRAIADDVRAQAATLFEAWDPQRGDFGHQLANPGSGSAYANEQAALNAVNSGLFYVDIVVKDAKVGRPAGLINCSQGDDCAALAESPYARVGKDFTAANLQGLRLLLSGCAADNAGLGFDDWLRAVEMGGLADDLLAALDDAQRQVENFDGRFEDAFAADPGRIAPLYAALKTITDLLKTQFISVLDLELPMTAEGDND